MKKIKTIISIMAKEQDKLATRYEDASGYTRSHIESLKTNESIKCRKCASDYRQLAELLRELQRWREFGGRIANVCLSYITEEQKEKLLEIMEVNADGDSN